MLQKLWKEGQKLSSWHSGLKTRSTRTIAGESENSSDWSSGLKTRSVRNNTEKEPFNLWNAVKESASETLKKTAQVPRNVAAGAGDILDLPIMAANYGLRSASVKSQIPHVGQGIAEGIDTLTGGYTKPTTSEERTAETVTRALSGIPAGAFTGAKLAATGIMGLSKLGRGLQKINPIEKTNLAGTAAGALAGHDYSESNPEDFIGSLGTGLAADFATRTAMGLASKKNWAKALKINPESAESFKEMGVSPTLGQISDNPLVKRTENTLKSIGFSSKLRNSSDEQYKKMLEILGPGAQGLAQTELEAGKAIKKSMADYSQKHRKVFSKLEKSYMDKINQHHNLVDVTDSLHFVKKLEHELRTNRGVSDFKKTPLGKEYESLSARASQNNGAVPFLDLKRFKKKLDNLISKSEIGNVDEAELMQLKDYINKDITDYMEGIGASKKWSRRNKYYAEYAEKRKEHLLDARTTTKNKANEIFDSIGYSGNLDRDLLDTIYASQKKSAQNQTTDSLFQKMGKKGNEYDIHLFAKRFSAQPKETQDILLRSKSEPMRKKIKAVVHSIDTIKDLAKFGNPSGTAYTEALIKSGYLGAAVAHKVITGESIPDSAWHYALLAAGSSAVARGMFTNPKFINWALKGAKMSPKARVHHIAGIKGILGRPVYQEIRNALSGGEQEE